ncbi:hypothetical protein RUM43_012003 [Polyplax serrata]|uniref:Uncharacterized protein n=1 Tax=Polyplax serrata TaxID=468196 RepID=A0AAN8S4A7_POLSC
MSLDDRCNTRRHVNLYESKTVNKQRQQSDKKQNIEESVLATVSPGALVNGGPVIINANRICWGKSAVAIGHVPDKPSNELFAEKVADL